MLSSEVKPVKHHICSCCQLIKTSWSDLVKPSNPGQVANLQIQVRAIKGWHSNNPPNMQCQQLIVTLPCHKPFGCLIIWHRAQILVAKHGISRHFSRVQCLSTMVSTEVEAKKRDAIWTEMKHLWDVQLSWVSPWRKFPGCSSSALRIASWPAESRTQSALPMRSHENEYLQCLCRFSRFPRSRLDVTCALLWLLTASSIDIVRFMKLVKTVDLHMSCWTKSWDLQNAAWS